MPRKAVYVDLTACASPSIPPTPQDHSTLRAASVGLDLMRCPGLSIVA